MQGEEDKKYRRKYIITELTKNYTCGNTYSRSSTSLGQTPVSMTDWILSFVPSERYERAQQASVRTSSSLE